MQNLHEDTIILTANKWKERQHVWHSKNPIGCETFYREMIRGLTWRVAGLQDTEGSRSVYQSLAIKFYSNFVRHRLQSRWTRVIPNRFLARPRFLPLKPPASSHLSPLKIHQNLAPMFCAPKSTNNTKPIWAKTTTLGTSLAPITLATQTPQSQPPKILVMNKRTTTNYNRKLIKKYPTKKNHGVSQNPQLWERRLSHLSCSYDNKNRGMTHKTIKQPIKPHDWLETHRPTFAEPTKTNWL